MEIAGLKFDDHGLLPAIVQDARTGDVLMVAYMNRESLQRSIESGETWFYSRSRQSLWHKGETSGRTQVIRSITADCDGDALLIEVDPQGPACHTGSRTCFFNGLIGSPSEGSRARLGEVLEELSGVIRDRLQRKPEGSYTAKLSERGRGAMAKKLGEEALEVALAALTEGRDRTVSETADLLYHLLALLTEIGISPDDIARELARRRK